MNSFPAQLLLAYAVSASNVRLERTSRACLEVGGAIKEIMGSYENTGHDGSHVAHGEKQGEIISAMEVKLIYAACLLCVCSIYVYK